MLAFIQDGLQPAGAIQMRAIGIAEGAPLVPDDDTGVLLNEAVSIGSGAVARAEALSLGSD
jgi:hypothetical protein